MTLPSDESYRAGPSPANSWSLVGGPQPDEGSGGLLIDRSVMAESPRANGKLKAEFAELEESASLLELVAEIARPLVDANRQLRDIWL